jgi:hypothetical protein
MTLIVSRLPFMVKNIHVKDGYWRKISKILLKIMSLLKLFIKC